MNKKLLFSVLKIFAVLITITIITMFTFIYLKVVKIKTELQDLNYQKIHVKDTTKIYDQNLNLITELGIEKRDVIEYEEISSDMINAIIAIEDAKFFEHQGIDYLRIISALIENTKAKTYKEGASTLTQQLVKLSFLTNDKTIERKVKEMFISIEIENYYPKEKIIEAYLNRVLFGGRIYGIEKASQYYFNKNAKFLNYEEAAILAGMVQSPNRFNPYINPEKTKLRQITVLKAMFKNNYITKKELQKAINNPIENLIFSPQETEFNENYHEYLDYVIYELIDKYKLDPFNDSLQIVTHLDLAIQDEIREIENDEVNHPNDKTQTGIVVLETKTGFIRGIGGGRNYRGSLTFNYATDAKLQPGSTIKPILDYGPAIEYLKYSPAQPYFDEKIYFRTAGSRYFPIYNYDNIYKGMMTMREAIIDSRNVTAVKAYRDVGSDKAYFFAKNLGLETNEQITEAHALGGYKFGYSVLDMAAAYAPFGNGGIYHEPTTINYILKDKQKLPLIQKTHQAMREDTAYLMTDILRDNMVNGTASRANVKDLYLAGKTGQTNYAEDTRKKFNFPSNSVRDSWFIGYTTKYTTAVWLGYDKIEKDTYLSPSEARASLDMFRKIMNNIHINHSDSKPFLRPDNIIEVEVETNTYPLALPNEYTPTPFRKTELFIKGTEPKTESNYFKRLEMPKNFSVSYDDIADKAQFSWDKYEFDYNHNDYKLMESIHAIQNFYDYYKNKTQQEYYQDIKPSFLTDRRITNTRNQYCQSNNPNCSITQHSLNSYIALLEELKQFEINLKLQNNKIKLLSEGEISILRGYPTWNGYRNGIFSTLGNIEYQIYGHDGMHKILLYQGPHINTFSINMSLEEFLTYQAFSINADFAKYRYRLISKSNLYLNPFFSIDSLI